jgi:hypothetical protein
MTVVTLKVLFAVFIPVSALLYRQITAITETEQMCIPSRQRGHIELPQYRTVKAASVLFHYAA